MDVRAARRCGLYGSAAIVIGLTEPALTVTCPVTFNNASFNFTAAKR